MHTQELWAKYAFACLLLSLATSSLATTILPYKDLGHLGQSSDAVVLAKMIGEYDQEVGKTTYRHFHLTTLKSLKGPLQVDDAFSIQRWSKRVGASEMAVWGDVHLEHGHTYLLFLDRDAQNRYRPICLSYYIHEEIEHDGQYYLVPSEHAMELVPMQEIAFEAPQVFPARDLIENLESVLAGQKPWNSSAFKTEFSLVDFYPHMTQRAADHCTNLTSGGLPMRWENLDVDPVYIRYVDEQYAECSSVNDRIESSIADLNYSYGDLRLEDGGSVSPMHDCSNYTAVGSNFRSWIDANLTGGSRNIVIQYGDPCGEFPELGGCSGVAAIGGIYRTGDHKWKGQDWRSAGYGYVILNEGTDSCFCHNHLVNIITHEISHALGLGHIDASLGHANLNPSCCHNITDLDHDCVQQAYQQFGSLLPVTLERFEGRATSISNSLFWESRREEGLDKYALERAIDGGAFAPLEIVLPRGDDGSNQSYTFVDRHPPAKSSYRLRMVDLDGSEQFSSIVTLERPRIGLKVYPTRVENQLIVEHALMDARYEIHDVSGRLEGHGTLASGRQIIDTNVLAEGTYVIQVLASGGVSQVRRFFKH